MIPLNASLSLTNRSRFVVFVALTTLILAVVVLAGVSRLASAGAGDSKPKVVSNVETQVKQIGCCGGEGDDTPHLLAGSYYTVKKNFSAKLLLNNKGPLAIEVNPTLFSLSGERFDLPPVTVDSNSHRFEDFGAWAAIAGEKFREGSVQVFHKGKDLVLGTQIYLTDEVHSLSFEEKLTELAKPGSPRLAGVWWLPSPKGAIDLVLSNTNATALSVTMTITGEAPKREASTTVDLAPHETKVLDVERDLFGREERAMSSFGAISLKHNGGPRALLARAMALDASRGYSLPIQFVDPGSAKSANLQGAGLRIGKAGRESLSPKVVAYNAGSSETLLSGRVPYTTTEGTNGEITLPRVVLAPGETEVIDIEPSARAHGLSDNIATAGLEFEYTGEMGSVITSAFSVSRKGNQVFRVPLWDIAAQRSATGGYPWYIDGNSSTVVYIKNVTDEPQGYRMYLKFSSGDYVFPLATVAPGETKLIDIKKLQDHQVADVNGLTIPAGETGGQLQWSMTGGRDRVLIGRSEQVDVVRGISSNYACQNCCGNSFYDGWVTPFEVSGVGGFQQQFTAMQRDSNCYGQVYQPYTASIPTYTSGDTSICNPGWSTGDTTGGIPGETTIFAGWSADTWFMGLNEQCEYTPFQAVHEALCAVLAVRFVTASEPGTSNTASFNQFNSANLNTGSCGGERFSIKATFQLPNFSAGCCTNPTTSFVTLTSDNKFEFAPSPVDDTIYDFFGDENPPNVVIFLKRRANNAGTTDGVRITVGGSYQNQESYSGQGTVHPICQ